MRNVESRESGRGCGVEYPASADAMERGCNLIVVRA
jgi:hypothetical protein